MPDTVETLGPVGIYHSPGRSRKKKEGRFGHPGFMKEALKILIIPAVHTK